METHLSHKEQAKGLPSGSGFDSEFRCMGKRELEKRFGEREDTPDSLRGDRIHKALETSNFDGLSGGESLTASICLDTESVLVDKYGFHGAAEVIWEKRMWDVDDDLTPLWSVQVDYLRLEGRRGLLIDHKTGWGIPVPIDTNWQMKAQAAIVWLLYDLDEVVAALSHPHHPDTRWEARVWSAKECAMFMTTIRGNTALIQQPDQPRTPNGISCQFCRARHMCPERLADLDKVAHDVINDIRERGYTALIDRTPEQRAEHYRSIDELMEHCQRVKEQYTSMVAHDPDAVKGYRIQKAWQRGIKDEVEAMERVEREFGNPIANECMVFSLTELEEAVRRTLKISKVKANDKVEEVLKDVIKWTPKRPWLVETRNYLGETQQQTKE